MAFKVLLMFPDESKSVSLPDHQRDNHDLFLAESCFCFSSNSSCIYIKHKQMYTCSLYNLILDQIKSILIPQNKLVFV